MQNTSLYLKENLGSVSKKVFVAPGIPDKKLNNAAKAYNLADSFSSIVAIFDNTVFGSAKEGIVFTGVKMIYRKVMSDPVELVFNDFETVEYIEDITTNDKGKEKKEEYINITLKDGSVTKIKGLMDCDYQQLATVLDHVHKDFSEYKEENQIITLAEMPEELKVAYVKVIVNMAFSSAGEVDKKEFAEILLLMTRLDLSTESRFTLRGYIGSADNQEPLPSLLGTIDGVCSASHNKSIKISLVKDLISTYMSVNGGSYQDFAFLNENKALLGVSDGEIELAAMAIEQDFNMLREDVTDDVLKKGMKELGAKAAAVGVPVAAVYLSGSVIGMSAAGITSGLATIGMGGFLGFSSMATGIGVAVLIGVGAYKGIRQLTGANELDKHKRRELMLNEVIKQTQTTLAMLIDDLNHITVKFNNALNEHGFQEEKIRKLQKMMTALTGAASVLNQKSSDMQKSSIKLRCPAVLDEAKLKSLTAEPVKQQFYPVIMSFYEEHEVQEEKQDQIVTVTQLRMKQGIPNKDLEKIADIFEGIGYFKAGDVIKGKLSGLFS